MLSFTQSTLLLLIASSLTTAAPIPKIKNILKVRDRQTLDYPI